jgi:hypothetical protein
MFAYVAYRHFAVLAEALKILQELLCVLGKAMTPRATQGHGSSVAVVQGSASSLRSACVAASRSHR